MAEVKPTRSELIKLKKSIKLAKGGHKLLKKKRDGLILDFFEVLKDAKTVRQDLTDEYVKALEKANIARSVESDVALKSIAMSIKDKPFVEVGSKNIMGVVVPKISSSHDAKTFDNRGYGLMSGSLMIDEVALSYEKLVKKIILAAEVETALRKLLKEIEKTKRRVNALEFEVIPRMENTAAFIRLRLEEMERENIFRMKRIKK